MSTKPHLSIERSTETHPAIAELRKLEYEMALTLPGQESPFAEIPESLKILLLSLLNDRPMDVGEISEKDWEIVFSSQQLQGIPAILYYKTNAMGNGAFPSETIVSCLRDQLLMNRVEIFHAQAQLRKIIRAFVEKGITPLLIKGIALAYTVYPDSSLRRAGNDIDILVKPEEFLQARNILLAQGYSCESYRFEILNELQCEETFWPPNASNNRLKPVDLHWALNVACGKRRDETTRGIFARSISVKTQELVFQTMYPVDALVHGAVHLMQNHLEQMKLLWICDISFLAGALLRNQDWKTLQERSQDWDALLAVQYALKLAVVWAGLRLPEKYSDFSLWPKPQHTEKQEIERALAKQNRPDIMLRLLLQSAPDLSAKLRLLKNLVFPDKEYLLRLDMPGKNRFWPGAYLSYWQGWIKKSRDTFKGRNAL